MSDNSYAATPYAPDYFAGLDTPPKEVLGYEDRPFDYIYNPPNNQLTALQEIPKDQVSIDSDADFLLDAWFISKFTGAFQIQITDANNYQLQSGFVNSAALSQSSSDPTPFKPSHPFPASGKLYIAITDLSDATNPLQIVFRGRKRYRISK